MILDGRTSLVTGASRGIGAAVARALAGAGARVALVARSGDALSAVAAGLGAGHLALVCDLTRPAEVTALAARVTSWAGGPPAIIVNSAGTFPRAALHEQDSDEFVRALDLNLAAPFRVIKAFLAPMRERGSGDLVTIGSVADRHVYAGNGAYSASKFGARALHEVLRAETRGTGIRATLVSPGPVDTDIWKPHEGSLGRLLPARVEMLVPDDVARAVMFAVGQPSDVTMEEIRLARS
ncbi:MAG TPA: SDR family NAD(P)-dependent oxidoreductase [Gemmatimonadaceae bacterium]|nr:SDR family NAD(P)-dependent oxidoreductase [Gemmatimonadaceae bacterium]